MVVSPSRTLFAFVPANDRERMRREGPAGLAFLHLGLPLTLLGNNGVGIVGGVDGVERAG